jgi:hypothetical protein
MGRVEAESAIEAGFNELKVVEPKSISERGGCQLSVAYEKPVSLSCKNYRPSCPTTTEKHLLFSIPVLKPRRVPSIVSIGHSRKDYN